MTRRQRAEEAYLKAKKWADQCEDAEVVGARAIADARDRQLELWSVAHDSLCKLMSARDELLEAIEETT